MLRNIFVGQVRWKLLLFECVISKSFEKHESFGAFNIEISCVYAWRSLHFYLVKNSQRPIISARYQYRLYTVCTYLDFSLFSPLFRLNHIFKSFELFSLATCAFTGTVLCVYKQEIVQLWSQDIWMQCHTEVKSPLLGPQDRGWSRLDLWQ